MGEPASALPLNDLLAACQQDPERPRSTRRAASGRSTNNIYVSALRSTTSLREVRPTSSDENGLGQVSRTHVELPCSKAVEELLADPAVKVSAGFQRIQRILLCRSRLRSGLRRARRW